MFSTRGEGSDYLAARRCDYAYLVTVLSASHLHGPTMNAFLKDVDLRRHIFLDVSLRLLAPTGRGRTLGSTS